MRKKTPEDYLVYSRPSYGENFMSKNTPQLGLIKTWADNVLELSQSSISC